ncbi:hypothetical protein CBR_g18714 [Chara braunii]|uniref:Uncharacterized protein n=1 Tax=Chara braunii TaxID=69332 RepID=A0A388KWH2_CHABU|nr:hypothetical protein CBR_g18714 [Chara braunii]|eukprot:GBG74303.1 hypothetical protein CBR_g18714 [Chara braunii]
MVAALLLIYRTKTIEVSNFVTVGAKTTSINHTSEACTTEGMPVAGHDDCGAFTITGRGLRDGDKTRGCRSGEDRGGRVVGRWVKNEDKTRGNKGGEDGGDEVRGGEVADAETWGAVVDETRRGDSVGGNAGMATDAIEEHIETNGDTTTAGRAPAESIVKATNADEEEAANRKGAFRVINDMEGVTKTDEDAGATDAGNEEEVVIGVTGVGNEEGVV